MVGRMFRSSVVGMAMGLLLMASRLSAAQAVTAVPQLDLNQFTGTWYEIARYPNKRQKHCTGDAFELITPAFKPKRLLIVTSCLTANGFTEVRNATAKSQDKSGSGRLKVSYTWPFSTKYWVLALGPDYSWCLVGTPNRKGLWVLSRTAVMKPEVLTEIEGKAAAEGFATDKLVRTPQHVPAVAH